MDGAREKIRRKLGVLPETPGVYLMKNGRGRVIYVGKARALRRRVSSYFQKSHENGRIAALVAQVQDFGYILTDTEKEALILENSLIKKHKPHYNVLLRDDKTYPYLKLDPSARFPRLEVTRRIASDGSRYFGPYSSVTALKRTLKLLGRLFPLRQCANSQFKTARRPCLNFELGRCKAPCAGLITQEDYAAMVREVVMFFEGRSQGLLDELKARMQAASQSLEFETAAWYRDRLADISRTVERQKMVSLGAGDQDVFGLARERGQALAVLLAVRAGVLIGRRTLELGLVQAEPAEILESALTQYYAQDNFIPSEVLLPLPTENMALVAEWLKDRKGGAVRLAAPLRGAKRRLAALAQKNAAAQLQARLRSRQTGEEALVEIQKRLGLKAPPRRIEGFDMSNLGGAAAVGGMVVWDNGGFDKASYRRYAIKQADGRDDYAMMREVLTRRLKRQDQPFADLILLDGGRGQIAMALAAIAELGLADPPPVAGIAKGRDGQADHVWRPGQKNPAHLKPGSQGLLLLMRIRDEAHRWVQGFHHQKRRGQVLRSPLDQAPGIGPARKKALLTRFGSLAAIKKASEDELAQVKGMSRPAARGLWLYLHAGAAD